MAIKYNPSDAQKKSDAVKKAGKTEYFLPDSARTALTNYYKGQGFGSTLNFDDAKINSILNSIESTGKLPADLPEDMRNALPEVKPYYEGLTGEVGNLKQVESTLSDEEFDRYIELVNEANKGDPSYPQVRGQKKEQFKQEIIGKLSGKFGLTSAQVEDVSEKAADRFVVKRMTGEQSLIDFIKEQAGLAESPEIRAELNPLQGRLGEFLTSDKVPGAFGREIERLSKTQTERKKAAAEASRVQAQEDLATGQRAESSNLFNQAIASLQTTMPTYTPEFTAEMLGNIQSKVLEQGGRALSDTEARAQERGITGSSIEQFGLAQTEGQIAQALRDATFQFLLQSGQSGQRNREFLANSLFQQSGALLGAGQGTAGLAQQSALTGQQLDLQRTQLANQIAQFNQTFSESQRQFNDQMSFQQKTAQENIGLLLQQLSQPRQKNFGSAILGGAGTGAGLGALLALPTGGLSVPIGALIGAGAGGLGGGLLEGFGE